MRAMSFALAVAALLAPSAVGAETLERLREAPTLRLGHRVDAAPFSSLDGARPAGFTVALCERVARRVAEEIAPTPLEIAWTALDVAERFAALEDGRIDLLCGATTVTDERRARLRFSSIIYLTDGAILVDAAAYARGAWAENIGVLRATTSAEVIERLLTESGDGFASLNLFPTRQAGLDALRAGEIDSFFGDRALLAPIAAAEPERFLIVETSFSAEPYAIAARPADAALIDLANEALRTAFAAGEIDALHARWLGGAPLGAELRALYEGAGDRE